MIKTATFTALTLLATLTAVQAAMKNASPSLSPVEAGLQAGGVLKAKMPPRRSFSPKDAVSVVERLQFD